MPRSRFLPVKTTSDLFLVMSNLYDMHSGTLTMSHRRLFATTPIVKITGPHFRKVGDFSFTLLLAALVNSVVQKTEREARCDESKP